MAVALKERIAEEIIPEFANAKKLYKEKDFAKSLKLFEAAANKGCEETFRYLSFIEKEINKDDSKSMYWILENARIGDEYAKYLIEGYMKFGKRRFNLSDSVKLLVFKYYENIPNKTSRDFYHMGEGSGNDYEKRLEYFTEAAKSSDYYGVKSMKEIAEIYYHGDFFKGNTVPKDYSKAIYWFKKVEYLGKSSQYDYDKMVKIYTSGGYGIEKNEQLAAEYKAKYEAVKNEK